jgi:hypothetical protein
VGLCSGAKPLVTRLLIWEVGTRGETAGTLIGQ